MKIGRKLHRLKLKTHEFVRRHPRLALLIGAIGLILASSMVVFALTYQKPEPAPISVPKPKPVAPDPVYYSRLSGQKVKTENDETAAVTAIMIENSPDARPQSGLKKAGIVYEAIAEGGITRFLALYQDEKPGLIGPVRSVRSYFVDWLAPYQASVAHVGGSAAALREVRNGTYRDIDQFFNDSTYWRAGDRYAPHNVYTNFKRLDALNQAKGYTKSDFTGFERSEDKPQKTPQASQVSINFSSPQYATNYSYQKECNCYARSLGGAAHKDREEGQITPKVVVALMVDMRHVMEDGWREAITTTGTGKATIFQNGDVIEATWSKKSASEPLEFLDKDGKVLPINRGQTWISAVPNGQGSVSWK